MEKIINCYSLQQAEKDAIFYKLKLQDIMDSLEYEKRQYESDQAQKIKHFQKEIRQKNLVINKLYTDLQKMQKSLYQKSKQNENYKVIIQHLKQQFFNMFQAVKKISDYQNTDQSKLPTLKRVKSDLQRKKPKNIQISQKENQFGSPLKQMRLDINSYFINLKQKINVNINLKKSYDQKDSSKTKHSDNQLRSSASQKFKETTCFKDLLFNQNNTFIDTYAFKSLKSYDSQVSLRQTWAQKYKENNWPTSR